MRGALTSTAVAESAGDAARELDELTHAVLGCPGVTFGVFDGNFDRIAGVQKSRRGNEHVAAWFPGDFCRDRPGVAA